MAMLMMAVLPSSLFAQNPCGVEGVVVEASNFMYSPAAVEIEAGQTVVWVNIGGTHDVNGVSSTLGDMWSNPETFSHPTVNGSAAGVCMGTTTFDVPGVYNYDCSIGSHAANGMVATVTVTEPAQPATVADIVIDSPDHTVLEAAVIEAGLADDLMGEGPLTVFAPTDAAFTALLAALEVTADELLANPDLASILLYHVVSGNVMSTDLSDGMSATTLNGEDVVINISANGVIINGTAMVTVADITADNGVVHVIDAVLLPGTNANTTVMDIISESVVHESLEAALIQAGLDEALNGEGPFTVFAPTDDALATAVADLGVTLEMFLASPILTQVLSYHAASGNVMSGDITDGMMVTMLNGQDITINITAEGVVINETALVTIADLTADNGVVHVIDAVLLPQPPMNTTVVDIIVESPDHTVLEAAVIAAGLADDLSAEGPFTVFAPTDAAFTALLEALEVTADELLANPDLASILLYHVVSGNVLSTDLSDGQIVETLNNGQSIEINFTAEGVTINGTALVVVADLTADNGVVHVIDAVLLPSSGVDEAAAAAVNIFPVPADDVVNVVLDVEGNVFFEIRDITGRVVENGNWTNGRKVLDVSSWTPGIYTFSWGDATSRNTRAFSIR